MAIDNDAINTIAFESFEKILRDIQQRSSLVSHTDHKTSDQIHSLRIACRRAIAASGLYKAVLPKDCRRRLRSKLTKIIRKSSRGRDLDVMIQSLKETTSSVPVQILRKLKKQRQRAFLDFQNYAANASLTRIRKQLRTELLKSSNLAPPLDGHLSISTWIEARVTQLADQTLCHDEPSEWTARRSHHLRIRLKQLRYTLDVAAPFVARMSDSPLADLLAMPQSMLGKISDLHFWIQEFEKQRKKTRDLELDRFLRNKIDEGREDLTKRLDEWRGYWTPARREMIRGRIHGSTAEGLQTPLGSAPSGG